MNIIEKIDAFHETKKGYAVFGVVELGLIYIFVSICIDTANMWAYLATIILVLGFLRNSYLFAQLIYKESKK